ncbi:MAG: hypothetical protein KI792_13990 [Alphaproteobacteria bacterium]|nr:hypothetical protein [Alphaproteobacteria bacterium SS10]
MTPTPNNPTPGTPVKHGSLQHLLDALEEDRQAAKLGIKPERPKVSGPPTPPFYHLLQVVKAKRAAEKAATATPPPRP